MNKNILYVGNQLVKSTKYTSTLETLSMFLIDEGYSVITSSDKKNKIARLLDMISSVIKHRNWTNYVLIDTYSTTNFYYAYIISQLAIIFKIKYIPILHGGNLPERLIKSKKKCDSIFNNSYKNVAPSAYLKKEFEKKGYKVTLIPNIINLKDYIFKERKKLNPKLLYVRAFATIYNPKMAVEVLKKVKEKYPKAVLCMIGPDRDGTLKEVKT